jgi:chemotaxis protein methyltransferase CheR
MDKSLDLFCSILSRETGLSFPTSRYSFIMNRLAPLLEKYDSPNPSDLILKSKQDLKLRIDIINTLTTNETWFFRHPKHFEILRKDILPVLIKKYNKKEINIWSAGCSIGAELYSILITIKESIPESENIRINILGSDISYNAIKTAKTGVYDNYVFKETKQEILDKYFIKLNDNHYKIKEELKQDVTFEYLNLLETWPPRTFDIIFCRNTMIYFNKENKQKLTKKFFKSLELNGYFFTSANELVDLTDQNYGINKLFIRDEYIYQKINSVAKTSNLYFKTPTDLLRATNLLQKNSYRFQFGLDEKHNKKVRYIIVSSSDCDRIIKFLVFNSIQPSVTPFIYR